MNPSSTQPNFRTQRAGARAWPWALLAFGVCLAAISSQSLWIDEALTAVKASQTSLGGWWQAMLAEKSSDLQMPLYMIYVWGFAKIFGAGEWALRAANVPWFVAGFAALQRAIPKRAKLATSIVVLASPFAWYYLDEARPYAMQLGACLMIVASLFALTRNDSVTPARERRWVVTLVFGVIALSGSSMLGMIWAGAACLSVPALFSRQRLAALARTHWAAIFIFLGACLALSGYYLWMLKLGARASDVGRTGAGNVAFIAYELLGFSGLGPGRLEIRDEGVGAFAPFAKQLVMQAVLVCDVVLLGSWSIYRSASRRTLLLLALITALPAVLILGAGVAMHFRVLGRHFTPLLPVVLLIAGLGLEARWSRRHWASKPMAFAFVILSLAGCLSLRFAARHQKDDYRGAAAIANAALREGKKIWWNAGREGALYYALPLADEAGKSHALWLMNPTAETLSHLPAPDLIITSKPDVFDAGGRMAQFLLQGHYVKRSELTAFAVWQRPDAAGSGAQVKLAMRP